MLNALLVIGFAILSVSTVNAQKKSTFTKPATSEMVKGIIHLASPICPAMIELEGEKFIIPLNLDSKFLVQDKEISFTYKLESTIIDTKCENEGAATVSSVKWTEITNKVERK